MSILFFQRICSVYKKREFYYFGFEGQFLGKTNAVKQVNFKIQLPNILHGRGRLASQITDELLQQVAQPVRLV